AARMRRPLFPGAGPPCILRRMRRSPVLLLVLSAACHSTPNGDSGTGRGVVAFDSAPPAGAKAWDRPAWHKGGRFVLLLGGKVRFEVTVADVDEHGYTMVEAQGKRLYRSLDLGELAERAKDATANTREFAPEIRLYHWPLWVGKQWRCEYVDRFKD